ncbi:unnamed protein product [Penicillium olsonii]|nr:unnamed protein product [Penicillium olsonii]
MEEVYAKIQVCNVHIPIGETALAVPSLCYYYGPPPSALFFSYPPTPTIFLIQKKVNMPKEKSTRKAPEKRQARRKKDPNAPKRGLSAYMFFANDNRDKVREENPGISFGQVGKQLGDKWKALSEDDRKPYDDKAAKDKKRYEEEKAAYLAKGDDEEEEESS